MSGFLGVAMGHAGTSHVLILLANVACASTLACCAGLLAAWLLRRRSANVQHVVLLWSVALATISPAILTLGMTANFGWLSTPAERRDGQAVQAHVESVGLSAGSGSVAADSVGDQPAGGQIADVNAAEPQNAGPRDSVARGADEPVAMVAAQVVENKIAWPDVWSSLVPGIAAVWGAGILVRGGIFFLAWLQVRRLRRSLLPCSDRRIARLAAHTFASLKMPAVPIVESPQATIPFCLGFFRPAIVLPEGLADDLRPRQLRLVLLHEIAHLERRDHWVALLQVVGGVVIWWNPLLHAASRSLDCLREQICDDFVVAHAKQRRRYAEVLVQIAEWHSMPGLPHSLVSTLFGHDASDLETRVRRLLDRRSVRAVTVGHRAAACVAVFGLLISAPLLVPVLRAGDAKADPVADSATADLAIPESAASEPGASEVAAATSTSEAGSLAPVKAEAEETEALPATAVDLEGTWLLHLPAGFDHEVELVRIDKTHFRFLPGRLNMSGVYELQGDQLVIETPNDRRLTEFRWKLLTDGSLLLIDQPALKKIGGQYLGAVMRRKDQPALRNVAATTAAIKRGASLAGKWRMHLPAGVDRDIELTRIDKSHYRLSLAGSGKAGNFESKSDHLEIQASFHVSTGGLNMSGIYELKNDRLVIQKPDDPQLTEFEWQLRDDGNLVLVGQPAVGKTGASYLGAVMQQTERSASREEKATEELERQVLELLRTNQRTVAIKLYREKSHLDLKDSKEAVDALAERNGIKPVRNGAASSGSGALGLLKLGMWLTDPPTNAAANPQPNPDDAAK